MKPLGITHVNCHYQLCVLGPSPIVSSNCPVIKLTFRCNPNYRSNPWFYWVNVDYGIGNDFSTITGRLYMLLSHEPLLGYNNKSTPIYALVHSLKQIYTPKYSDLKCWNNDKLYSSSKVVSFSGSISGPTFVLPSTFS